jgi:hypothetical protein
MFFGTDIVETAHREGIYLSLGANQFGDRPRMIGEACFHRRRMRFLRESEHEILCRG